MRLRFAAAAGLLLLVGACADLKAVQDYAKASASVPGYDQATNEFATRFSRTELYAPEKDRKADQASGAERERAAPDLLAVHRSLQNYMVVLGKLAGDTTFDLGKPLGEAQKAIVPFPGLGLDANTVNAYGSIGQLVAKWALRGVQQHYVIELVTEADQPVQALIVGMRQIVGVYKTDLRSERNAVEGVFEINRLFLRDAVSGRDKLLAVLAADHFAAKTKEFGARAKKLDELDKALAKIATGHSELRKNVNNLSSHEFANALKAIAQDIWSAKGQIEKLN